MTPSPTPAWPDNRPIRYASPLGPRPPATQPPGPPPLYAPKGGVTYRGDYYQGGESLPLFQDDEQALRAAGAHNRESQALRDFQSRPAPKKEFRLAVPQVGPADTLYEDQPLEDISGATPDVLGRQRQTHDLASLPDSPEGGLAHLPAEIRPFVLPEEASRLSRNQAARVVEAFNALPPDLEFMAATRLGEAKRGWYRSTARDLVSLFGSGTPSFVAVLAATSPQKSVAANLRNATRIWAEYQISMRGEGTPESIEAWLRKRRLLTPQVPMKGEVPNVVRALTDRSPHRMGTLSGPKVDSFRGDLLGDLSRVCLDTWAAALADIPQAWLGGKDSGLEEHTFSLPTGPYIAYAAKTRRVAHRLNQELRAGERPWEPAEVQETGWSAIRALAYLGGLSRRPGQGPALDPIQVLNSLTHQTVSNNADFSTLLLSDPAVLLQLQRLGLGRAVGVVRRAARRDRAAKQEIPGRPAEHAAALTDRAAVERVARRAGKYISGFMSPRTKLARPGRPVRHAQPRVLTPDPRVLADANTYLDRVGMEPHGDLDYRDLEEPRSRAIADLYARLPHAPQDRAVRAAYEAMREETRAQYEHLLRRGVGMEPWTRPGQPYRDSRDMRQDVLGNRHLAYYLGGDMPADHPLAGDSGMTWQGHPLTFNDLFRGVHDFYGHALYGNQFGPRGEEHAWRAHSRMYSPQARPAMTMETRGQNSWVNFGRHLRRPDGSIPGAGELGHIPPPQRPFADQKANVMPPEFVEEAPQGPYTYSHRGSPVRYAEGAAGWDNEPLIAASGNTEEDLSFEQALAKSQSGNQQAFRKVAEGVLAQVGLRGQSHDAVGDWDDGAENSLLSVIRQPTDPQTLRYAGAWYGLLGNQKAVLVFHPDPRGKDSVYTIQVPETDLGRVRQQLSSAGISARTLVPGPRGTRVVIYDQARSLRDRVALFASQHRAPIRESIGQGEYVGGSTRAEARASYRDIIARYEAARQAGGRGQGAQADQGGGGPVPPHPEAG